MAAPVIPSACGCQQLVETGNFLSVPPSLKFASPDDNPPSLPDILQELLHPAGPTQLPQCNGVEPSTSEEGRGKPWLRWPVSLEAVRESEPQRQLHAYLTSRKALVARTRQVGFSLLVITPPQFPPASENKGKGVIFHLSRV